MKYSSPIKHFGLASILGLVSTSLLEFIVAEDETLEENPLPYFDWPAGDSGGSSDVGGSAPTPDSDESET